MKPDGPETEHSLHSRIPQNFTFTDVEEFRHSGDPAYAVVQTTEHELDTGQFMVQLPLRIS